MSKSLNLRVVKKRRIQKFIAARNEHRAMLKQILAQAMQPPYIVTREEQRRAN